LPSTRDRWLGWEGGSGGGATACQRATHRPWSGQVRHARLPDDRLSLVDEHAVPASDEMSVKPAAVCPVQGADTPMKSCPVQSSWK
jgi:hypothetical protein